MQLCFSKQAGSRVRAERTLALFLRLSPPVGIELFACVTGETACTTPWVLRGLIAYLMRDDTLLEGELLFAFGYMAIGVGVMAQFLHRYGNDRASALRDSGASMLFCRT